MAPVTISAELAELPSASTTSGPDVQAPPGMTGTSFETPVASMLWYTIPSPTNWLATPIASFTYPPGLPRRSRMILVAPADLASLIAPSTALVAPVANCSSRIIATSSRPGTIDHVTSGRSNWRRVIVTSKSAGRRGRS